MTVKCLLILLGTLVAVMHIEAQQEALPGTCPDYPSMDKYNFKKGMDTWYAVNYMTAGRTFNYPCHTSIEFLDGNGYETISVKYKLNGQGWRYTIHSAPDDDNPEEYKVTDSDFANGKTYQAILDTDYNNYLVKVRCTDLKNDTYAYVVIVESRKRTLEEQYLEKAKRVIENAGFEPDLSHVPQDNC